MSCELNCEDFSVDDEQALKASTAKLDKIIESKSFVLILIEFSQRLQRHELPL
jgi:hypothetical protein